MAGKILTYGLNGVCYLPLPYHHTDAVIVNLDSEDHCASFIVEK